MWQLNSIFKNEKLSNLFPRFLSQGQKFLLFYESSSIFSFVSEFWSTSLIPFSPHHSIYIKVLCLEEPALPGRVCGPAEGLLDALPLRPSSWLDLPIPVASAHPSRKVEEVGLWWLVGLLSIALPGSCHTTCHLSGLGWWKSLSWQEERGRTGHTLTPGVLSYHNQHYQWGGFNNRNLFLIVLEAGSARARWGQAVFSVASLLGMSTSSPMSSGDPSSVLNTSSKDTGQIWPGPPWWPHSYLITSLQTPEVGVRDEFIKFLIEI